MEKLRCVHGSLFGIKKGYGVNSLKDDCEKNETFVDQRNP